MTQEQANPLNRTAGFQLQLDQKSKQVQLLFEQRGDLLSSVNKLEKKLDKERQYKALAVVIGSLFFFTTLFFFLLHSNLSYEHDRLEKKYYDLKHEKTVANGFSMKAEEIFEERYVLYPTDTLKTRVFGTGGTEYELLITNYYKRFN